MVCLDVIWPLGSHPAGDVVVVDEVASQALYLDLSEPGLVKHPARRLLTPRGAEPGPALLG